MASQHSYQMLLYTAKPYHTYSFRKTVLLEWYQNKMYGWLGNDFQLDLECACIL